MNEKVNIFARPQHLSFSDVTDQVGNLHAYRAKDMDELGLLTERLHFMTCYLASAMSHAAPGPDWIDMAEREYILNGFKGSQAVYEPLQNRWEGK